MERKCERCGEPFAQCMCPDVVEPDWGSPWFFLNRFLEEAARYARMFGFLALVLAIPALSHELPGIPPENQEWYQHAQTNVEARDTFPAPWALCCNHAELVPVKDIVFPTQEHGWQWNDNGTIKDIPSVIVHWNESAPDNMPTLFVYQGVMTCFYPPQGGV